ncbi:uncharacterized protein LOC132694484 [Panthera onca]
MVAEDTSRGPSTGLLASVGGLSRFPRRRQALGSPRASVAREHCPRAHGSRPAGPGHAGGASAPPTSSSTRLPRTSLLTLRTVLAPPPLLLLHCSLAPHPVASPPGAREAAPGESPSRGPRVRRGGLRLGGSGAPRLSGKFPETYWGCAPEAPPAVASLLAAPLPPSSGRGPAPALQRFLSPPGAALRKPRPLQPPGWRRPRRSPSGWQPSLPSRPSLGLRAAARPCPRPCV